MDRRRILLWPLCIWIALVLLGALSLGFSLCPGLPAKPMIQLSVVAVQAALILGLFMNLGKASALVRMTALIGAIWLSFLFLLAFADLATR